MTQITRDQHYVPAFYFKRFFMDRRHLLALTPDILIETEECLPPHLAEGFLCLAVSQCRTNDPDERLGQCQLSW